MGCAASKQVTPAPHRIQFRPRTSSADGAGEKRADGLDKATSPEVHAALGVSRAGSNNMHGTNAVIPVDKEAKGEFDAMMLILFLRRGPTLTLLFS